MICQRTMRAMCLVLCSFGLGAVCSIASLAASEQPTTEFVVAALQAQADACGPSLDVTYKWVSLAAQTEGTTRATIRYVRTPTMLLLQEESTRLDKTGSWVALDSSRSVHNRVTKDNRQIGVPAGNGKSVGRISTGAPNRFTSQPTMDIVYYPLLTVPLIERIAKGVVAEKQETVDGHVCWHVDIPQEDISTNHGSSVGWTVWLDPEIGLCPRLIVEKYFKNEAVSEEITREFENYKALGNGVFLPMSHVVQYSDGGGIALEVQKASLGTEIHPNEFNVTFPSGTRVFTLPPGSKKPISYTIK